MYSRSLYLLLSVLVVALCNLQGGNIVPGTRFSDDMQQVTTQSCFKVLRTTSSSAQSKIVLNTAVSFRELESQLKVDVSVSGNYGMFSGSAEAHYLRSVNENQYSLSLNYYHVSSERVSVELTGTGLNALTTEGKAFYKSGTNPYFGLTCGDRYVSAFDRGSLLVLSLNIKFANREEKESFEAKAGASYGSIVSASANIQKIANENNLNGFVNIQAFQRGGEPSRLAHILRKDDAGEYYALSCDLKNMKNCVSAASGLLDYAKTDFTTQFSFAKGVGLTPLGTGFTEHRPIKYVGLTPSKSFVTSKVEQQGVSLANELKKAQYYEGNFEQLLKFYPVPWTTTSYLYKSIKNSYDKAKTNINLILSPSIPSRGALGCFDTPDDCNQIYQSISSRLQAIDLTFLNNIKLRFELLGAVAFQTGDGTLSWKATPRNSNGAIMTKAVYMNIDEFSVFFKFEVKIANVLWNVRYKSKIPSLKDFRGDLCMMKISKKKEKDNCSHDVRFLKSTSPFFFTKYV
ncbi:hypothetical protein RCL1_002521 [Eukaryota sp. TZLM3-RCL]